MAGSRTRTVLLLAPLGLYVAHALLFRHYINDDAYITFRYSRSLAEGQGPYFNPGEHVEGYTNFLLMLLLSVVAKCAGAAALPGVAKAIGLVCGAVGVVVANVLATRLCPDREHAPLAGLLAAGLVAAAPGYAVNSMSGLETMLYCALIGTGVLLGESGGRAKSVYGSSLAFGAALLTRPDGALIFAVYWIACMARSFRDPLSSRPRRDLYASAAIVTAVFAAHMLFRLEFYDGEWLPNTYYAKQGGFATVTPWDYIRDGALAPFGGVFGGVFALLAALFPGAGRPRLLVLAVPALAGALSPFLIGTDWMLGQRFLVPYLPLLAVVVALGWFRLLGALSAPPLARSAFVLLILAGMWLVQGAERALLRNFVEIRAEGYKAGHLELARWLHDRCRDGDMVALMDIGIVGFELPEQIILDTSGLTDRFIAKSSGGFLSKQYDPAYVLGRKPRFIVLAFTSLAKDPSAIPSQLDLRPSSGAEERLYHDPGFQKDYTRHDPVNEGPAWLASGAASLGAERAFLHLHPGYYYFLVVYERSEAASASALSVRSAAP